MREYFDGFGRLRGERFYGLECLRSVACCRTSLVDVKLPPPPPAEHSSQRFKRLIMLL